MKYVEWFLKISEAERESERKRVINQHRLLILAEQRLEWYQYINTLTPEHFTTFEGFKNSFSNGAEDETN